jgi:hypothetical protein
MKISKLFRNREKYLKQIKIERREDNLQLNKELKVETNQNLDMDYMRQYLKKKILALNFLIMKINQLFSNREKYLKQILN